MGGPRSLKEEKAAPSLENSFPLPGTEQGEQKLKTCFPLLLHIPLKILPKQCKAGTTGDKLSAGKEDCLTSLTQPGNLLGVVVLNGSSRHEKFVILGTVYLSGLLL